MEVYRRSRRRTTTSNNLAFENDDILMEILLRLPMKVRYLCKAVCKRWFSLISSVWFTKCVLYRKNNPQWDFLYKSAYPKSALKVAFGRYPELNSQNVKLNSFFSDEKIALLCADNGLVLCTKRESLYSGHNEYYVCNPITGQLVSLPKPQFHEVVLTGFRVNCHDGITTYKVVRVIYNDDSGLFSNFEAFSSEVGEWRDTGVSWPAHDDALGWSYYERFNRSVTYEGIIHWYCGLVGGITAYDPDRNTVRIIKRPFSYLYYPAALEKIGMSCGHLCYILKNMEEKSLSVWVLENHDTEEWRLVKTITHTDFNHQISSFVFHPFDMNVIYWEHYYERKTVSLNLQTQELMCYKEGYDFPRFHYDGSLYPFVLPTSPTLVPRPIWETD